MVSPDWGAGLVAGWSGWMCAPAAATALVSVESVLLLHPATSPAPRSGDTMAYDPATRQLLLLGDTTTRRDIWPTRGPGGRSRPGRRHVTRDSCRVSHIAARSARRDRCPWDGAVRLWPWPGRDSPSPSANSASEIGARAESVCSHGHGKVPDQPQVPPALLSDHDDPVVGESGFGEGGHDVVEGGPVGGHRGHGGEVSEELHLVETPGK